MFELELELELGQAPPRQYAFRDKSPTRQPKTKAKGTQPKPRSRPRRGRSSTQLGSLDSEEAAQLEAALGVAPKELPPHLRCYALRRRNAASFSGPGVLPGEQEAGGVEYKLRLLDPTPQRFQQLVSQLNWRLSEGCGECLYCLGVEDNGYPRGLDDTELQTSLRVLELMAAEVGAAADVLQMPPGSSESLRCAVVRVARSSAPAPSYTDLRVAVAGGVDSGKSTLVGVLSRGSGGAPALDNGRGSSRMQVFRHKHEIESGHTSSISLQQLAYDAAGNVLNYSGLASLGPAELAGAAARVLRFFDLGGHERFSKTALHGLTCMLPDYVLLCVNAVTGVSWVTREHLAVAIALGIPLFIALTKTDQASEVAVQQVAAEIRSLLAAAVEQGGGVVSDAAELAPLVQSEPQAAQLAAGMRHSHISAPGDTLCVPLFPTSAVTGASLQLLHRFLAALQPAGSGGSGAGAEVEAEGMQGWQRSTAGSRDLSHAQQQQQQSPRQRHPPSLHQPAHFQIDCSFEVSGVGTGCFSLMLFTDLVMPSCVSLLLPIALGRLPKAVDSMSEKQDSLTKSVHTMIYSGTVVSGQVSLGDELLLGPLEGGSFQRVLVASIHRSKVAVQSAQQGQHATVVVQPLPNPGTSLVGVDAATGDGEWVQPAVLLPEQPLHADSASCLHAWMQLSTASSLPGSLPAGSGSGLESLPGGAACSAASLASSRSAAQLGEPPGQRQQQQQQLRHAGGSGELPHSWASSPQLLASSGCSTAPRPRKGAVLLDPSLQPQACSQFEAVLVLLGGHWPARGLLSGCFPPEGEFDEPDPSFLSPTATAGGGSSWPGPLPSLGSSAASDSGADGGVLGGSSPRARPHSLGKRPSCRRRSSRQLSYVPVVHCGSIRQAAQVVAMRELPLLPHCGSGMGGSSSEGGAGSGGDAWGDLLESLEGLLQPEGQEQGQDGQAEQQGEQEEEEDALSALLAGCDLCTEPSGDSSSSLLGAACQQGAGSPAGPLLDVRRLAGAVAAAGVLLPQSLASSGSGGAPTCPGTSTGSGSASASGSSGHASSSEGAGRAVAPVGAVLGAAGSSSSSSCQVAAVLERQRSLLGCEDIGCIVRATFRFVHNPEWLVEGARLIVRDRTTGRTSGAGYIIAAGCAQLGAAQ